MVTAARKGDGLCAIEALIAMVEVMRSSTYVSMEAVVES